MPAAEALPVSDAEAAALFADLAGSPRLVLAASGGPDSTALLLLAARWRASLANGPELVAVTVDHGLRPDSADEAAAVARLATRLGMAHRTLVWVGEKPRTRIQEAARNARYRLLMEAAREVGARHILTAHTLDDQAETVLFRLARGSGVAGLGGMARETPLGLGPHGWREPRQGEFTLLRPLLDIPKARLVATLARAGIAFADDPSNRDLRFARTRLRQAMPGLAAEGLNAARLGVLAQRARRAEAALEWATAKEARRLAPLGERAQDGFACEAAGFFALPAEIALRLLRRAIAAVGDPAPIKLAKLEALFAALQSASAASRPVGRTLAGASVRLAAGRLTVRRAPPKRHSRARARPASEPERRASVHQK